MLASLGYRGRHPGMAVVGGADDNAAAFFNDGLEHPRAARAATSSTTRPAGATSTGRPGQPPTDARADPAAELAGSGVEADKVLLDLVRNAGILLTHPAIMNVASGLSASPGRAGMRSSSGSLAAPQGTRLERTNGSG